LYTCASLPTDKGKPAARGRPATLEDLQNHLGEEVRVQSKAARDATEFGAREVSIETNENEDY
jgi:hypothetical protein